MIRTNQLERSDENLNRRADAQHALVVHVLEALRNKGYSIKSHIPEVGKKLLWPEAASLVGHDILSGEFQEGILFCWTGTSVNIAVNRIPGIRATLCVNVETACGARLWNNANVLCISMRLTSTAVVNEILDSWFATVSQSTLEDEAGLNLFRNLENEFLKTDLR